MRWAAIPAILCILWLAAAIPAAQACEKAASRTSDTVVAFSIDPSSALTGHFKDFTVTQSDITEVIQSWHRVTEAQWRHHYSHVSGGDRTGTLTLQDGRQGYWMVRPGGLARVTYDHAAPIYLAACKGAGM